MFLASMGQIPLCRASNGADQDEDDRVVEAFRFGLSVGAASCLTGENSVFDMGDVREIYESMAVTKV